MALAVRILIVPAKLGQTFDRLDLAYSWEFADETLLKRRALMRSFDICIRLSRDYDWVTRPSHAKSSGSLFLQLRKVEFRHSLLRQPRAASRWANVDPQCSRGLPSGHFGVGFVGQRRC